MTALRVCILTMFLTAFYILITVFITNIFFNSNSNGSLIYFNHSLVGSKLIGQDFKDKKHFHSRPSQNNYRNNLSGNSNYPYYSSKLIASIENHYQQFLSNNNNSIPDLNLITESASGLDPDITYKGALSQVERISINTGINKEQIINLININSKPRIAGIIGGKIINVLQLNLELNKIYAKTNRTR